MARCGGGRRGRRNAWRGAGNMIEAAARYPGRGGDPAHGRRQGQRHEPRFLRGDDRAFRRGQAVACACRRRHRAGEFFPPASTSCACLRAAALHPQIPAGLERNVGDRLLAPQAGGGGDQRPRDRRRLRACLRCRQAADGARGRSDRSDRVARGSAFSCHRHGDYAKRHGAAIFRGRDLQRCHPFAAGRARARLVA